MDSSSLWMNSDESQLILDEIQLNVDEFQLK
jgi:hypothetical protein